jgi:SAM-dependent methyltransferase
LSSLGAAYSAGASAWASGPAPMYERLAGLLVAFSPVPLGGRLVLDLGSGTGAGSRAALSVGARVIGADLALGMLLSGRRDRPPAAVGDAVALPFGRDAFDIVLAPFSLNHLDDPAAGVREVGRIGGHLVASTYAADDDHPAKSAVETALSEWGWRRPAWYDALKTAMTAWGTVEGTVAALERGGMRPLAVELRAVDFPGLVPGDLVAWRMGMPHSAGFVETLDPDARRSVFGRALELLGADPGPLVRRVIFMAAAAASPSHLQGARLPSAG